MRDKTERLSIKILEQDKHALKKMAAAEGEAMAVVVRRIIRQALNERNFADSKFRIKKVIHE